MTERAKTREDVGDETYWLNLSKEDFLSRWYSTVYRDTSYAGAANKAQRAFHSSIERDLGTDRWFPWVLEVGAHRGEHLEFVNHDFEHYVLSDVARPDIGGVLSSSEPKGRPEGFGQVSSRRYHLVVADIMSLPWADHTFDRLVCTCVLHHVSDPEAACQEMRRVLVTGGQLDIFLPSDPGLLFRIAKALGPMRHLKRQGLGKVKRLVDARDHRNHVGSLRTLVEHTFRNDNMRVRSYPVAGLSWNMALWYAYRIRKIAP